MKGEMLIYNFSVNIDVDGIRYMVLRTSSLKEWNEDDVWDGNPYLLTQLGYSIGINDAKFYKTKLKLRSQVEQLAFGVVHNACMGKSFLNFPSTFVIEIKMFKCMVKSDRI